MQSGPQQHGALTIFAILGSGLGSLVNTLFFIALSMTSSGGTVPIAATPTVFQWLSNIEPFHPIIEGVRAVLYFGGNGAAGLTDGWWRIAIGAAIAITLGLAVSALYGRSTKFARHSQSEIASDAPQS